MGLFPRFSEAAITEVACTFPGKMDKNEKLVKDVDKLLNVCVLYGLTFEGVSYR
jgi:hypothetical protein